MSKDENYFLRDWTVQETQVDGHPTPHDTPEPVDKENTFRFHRLGKRIVCQSIRRQGPRKPWEDAWEATAFVYEPVHDRLLGMVIIDGDPWILEITQWHRDDGRVGIRCGYIRYKHVPHPLDQPGNWDTGYWHGDGGNQ